MFFRVSYKKGKEEVSQTSGSMSSFHPLEIPEPLREMWDNILNNIVGFGHKDLLLKLVSHKKPTDEIWIAEIDCDSEEILKGYVLEVSSHMKYDPTPKIDFPIDEIRKYEVAKMYKEEKKGKRPYYNKNRPF